MNVAEISCELARIFAQKRSEYARAPKKKRMSHQINPLCCLHQTPDTMTEIRLLLRRVSMCLAIDTAR